MTYAILLRMAGQMILRAAGAMLCWWVYDTAATRIVRRVHIP